MIAGILNVVGGAFLVLYGALICCTTYLICFFCPILGLVPLILGIVEITTGMNIQKGVVVHNAKSIAISGLIVGCFTFNVIAIVMEVLAIVSLGKPECEEYIMA